MAAKYPTKRVRAELESQGFRIEPYGKGGQNWRVMRNGAMVHVHTHMFESEARGLAAITSLKMAGYQPGLLKKEARVETPEAAPVETPEPVEEPAPEPQPTLNMKEAAEILGTTPKVTAATADREGWVVGWTGVGKDGRRLGLKLNAEAVRAYAQNRPRPGHRRASKVTVRQVEPRPKPTDNGQAFPALDKAFYRFEREIAAFRDTVLGYLREAEAKATRYDELRAGLAALDKDLSTVIDHL